MKVKKVIPIHMYCTIIGAHQSISIALHRRAGSVGIGKWWCLTSYSITKMDMWRN